MGESKPELKGGKKAAAPLKKEKEKTMKSPGAESDYSATSEEGGRKKKRFTENIEIADEETEKQTKSSWAQRQGLPSKPGVLMKHGISIQKHENN